MESVWWVFAGVAGLAMLSLISHERQRELIRISVEKELAAKKEAESQVEPDKSEHPA